MQRKNTIMATFALVSLTTIGTAATVDAAMLVKFDVNGEGSGETAPGFTAIPYPEPGSSGSASEDGVTATITSNGTGSINRDSSNDELLDDAAFAVDASASSPLTLTFEGLTAGTPYDFTVYSADTGTSSTDHAVTDYFLGTNIDPTTDTPFLNDVPVVGPGKNPTRTNASFTGRFTAGTSSVTLTGVIDTSESGTPAFTIVNGFELQAVPEPSSLTLLGLGAGLMLLGRATGRGLSQAEGWPSLGFLCPFSQDSH